MMAAEGIQTMRLPLNNTSATTTILKAAFALCLFGISLSGFTQSRVIDQGRPSASGFGYQNPGYQPVNDDLRCRSDGHYPGAPAASPCYRQTNFSELYDTARRESEQSATYQELAERQRARAAQEAAVRARMATEDGIRWYEAYEPVEPQFRANPEAPDQADLLKNSKDRDFILRNFRTMYVDARDAKYFGSDQMKAALGKNKDFWKLNIRIVDDRRVADVVLKVGYTFAWDYPFELTHQNTTFVLVSGKGEGPFSGPLGAADVARQFVNMAKPWREEKEKSHH